MIFETPPPQQSILDYPHLIMGDITVERSDGTVEHDWALSPTQGNDGKITVQKSTPDGKSMMSKTYSIEELLKLNPVPGEDVSPRDDDDIEEEFLKAFNEMVDGGKREERRQREGEILKKDAQEIEKIRASLGIAQPQIQQDQSRELSEVERERLREEIREAYNKAAFGRKGSLDDYLFAVGHGFDLDSGKQFDRVDGEIGERYDSHGIAKIDQLSKLLTILENGIDQSKPFDTAPFEVPNDKRAALGAALGTPGGTAYKDGIAVVTSAYGKKLSRDGIAHVFVNDVFQGIRESLAQLFPLYQFHLLSEQKKVLEDEAALQKS